MKGPGMNNTNTVLIGYMGSGKSTVAAIMADRYRLKLVDTDAMIERATGKTISDIFATEGEQAFRQMETQCLKKIADAHADHLIVATGGGSVLREENQALLKEIGKVVYLKVTPETAYARVKNAQATRPLLQGPDPYGRIVQMLAERENAYLRASDIIIATDDLTAETIADRVFDLRYDN